MRITGNGEKSKVKDRRCLIALDDLEVRRPAQRFGEYEKCRDEQWVLTVPGLNVKENYIKDNTLDPCRWILREAKNDPIFSVR